MVKQTPAFWSHNNVSIQYCSKAVQCNEIHFCFPIGICCFLLLNKNYGQFLWCMCVCFCLCVCACVCVCVYACAWERGDKVCVCVGAQIIQYKSYKCVFETERERMCVILKHKETKLFLFFCFFLLIPYWVQTLCESLLWCWSCLSGQWRWLSRGRWKQSSDGNKATTNLFFSLVFEGVHEDPYQTSSYTAILVLVTLTHFKVTRVKKKRRNRQMSPLS